MNNKTKPEAMETALRYLEHRARTTKEIRDRLADAGYEAEEIRSCLERLTDLHYIDDGEYALAYLRRHLEKRRGRLRYFRELAERGISRETAQAAIYEYEDEENVDLSEVEHKNALQEAARILDGRAWTDKEKARAGRRLASLGYDTSQIYGVLGELQRNTL